MQVIPVIDLLGGLAVRAVAGRRAEYRPVESVLTRSHQPLEVAEALRTLVGHSRLYVADLDAILHQNPQWAVYRQLADAGFHTLIDAGLKSVQDAMAVLEAGAQQIIVGLESWPEPESLRELCLAVEPSRIWFSLDLKGGQPLAGEGWLNRDPLEIAAQVVEQGVGQLIVLDLAQVGTGLGVPTFELCRVIRQRWPSVKLITGGGVRTAEDLLPLEGLELEGVLVASALHDGQMTGEPGGVSPRRFLTG